MLTTEHLLHLERGDALLGRLDFRPRLDDGIGVAFERELEEDPRLVELCPLASPAVEGRAQLRALALHLLRALVVVPEARLLNVLVEGG